MERILTLKPHQVAHFKRIQEILKVWFVAVDNTGTGGGKTVIANGVAMALGLSLVVIAPPVVHASWRETAKRYRIPLLFVASYEKLRAGNCEIIRKLSAEELQERGALGAPSEFEHTEYFAKLLEHGILLVFDEYQNLKTDKTLQLKAAHTLIRALVHHAGSCVSRALLSSATPGDKHGNAVSILKLLGVLTNHTLQPDGVVEIGEIAREINPVTLTTITEEFGGQVHTFTRMKSKRAAQFAFDVYRDIFGPCLSSSCHHLVSSSITASSTGGYQHTRCNGFYKFPEADNLKLREAYEAFSSLSSFNGIHITQILMELESAKINTLARLVKQKLNTEKNRKVIVYLNFRSSLEGLSNLLTPYAPLTLNGSTSDGDRIKALTLFQKPSDEARLLITHPQVGGVGVDLDDKHGDFPRTQFVSALFSFISTCQIMGRVARTSTKSNSESFLVFSDAVPDEIRILENLSGKAGTLRGFRPDVISTSSVDDNSNVVYPGEYPSYFEQ